MCIFCYEKQTQEIEGHNIVSPHFSVNDILLNLTPIQFDKLSFHIGRYLSILFFKWRISFNP